MEAQRVSMLKCPTDLVDVASPSWSHKALQPLLHFTSDGFLESFVKATQRCHVQASLASLKKNFASRGKYVQNTGDHFAHSATIFSKSWSFWREDFEWFRNEC